MNTKSTLLSMLGLVTTLASTQAFALGATEAWRQLDVNPVSASIAGLTSAPSMLTSNPGDAGLIISGSERRLYRAASPEAAKAILNLRQARPIDENVDSKLVFIAAGVCGQRKQIKEFKSQEAALACIIERSAKYNR